MYSSGYKKLMRYYEKYHCTNIQLKWSPSSKHGEENERGGKTILFSKQGKKGKWAV